MPLKNKPANIKKEKKTEVKTKEKPIKAVLIGDNIFSNKKEAIALYEKSRFGEFKDGRVLYSVVEALYLLEKGKLEISENGKKISFEKFMEKTKENDSKIGIKFLVFRDLRNKGYVVKTALKFGAEFRIYDKGFKPGEEHAKWILYPVRESEGFTWHDFSAKNRVAHSTKKNLLIGIVDEENDVTYYEIKWTRP